MIKQGKNKFPLSLQPGRTIAQRVIKHCLVQPNLIYRHSTKPPTRSQAAATSTPCSSNTGSSNQAPAQNPSYHSTSRPRKPVRSPPIPPPGPSLNRFLQTQKPQGWVAVPADHAARSITSTLSNNPRNCRNSNDRMRRVFRVRQESRSLLARG